jgi:hypothetical protein
MKNVSDRSCRENQNTFYVPITFFFWGGGLKLYLYEIMWENNVQVDRPQMTVQHMHIACWILYSKHTLFLFFRQ